MTTLPLVQNSKPNVEAAPTAMAAQRAVEQENNALRQRLIALGVDPDSISGIGR
jgi:hypothetical protein